MSWMWRLPATLSNNNISMFLFWIPSLVMFLPYALLHFVMSSIHLILGLPYMSLQQTHLFSEWCARGILTFLNMVCVSNLGLILSFCAVYHLAQNMRHGFSAFFSRIGFRKRVCRPVCSSRFLGAGSLYSVSWSFWLEINFASCAVAYLGGRRRRFVPSGARMGRQFKIFHTRKKKSLCISLKQSFVIHALCISVT